MTASAGFELRQLGLDDMHRAARVHRISFDERLPWLAGLHTPEEDRCFFQERVFRSGTLWGASSGDVLVGIIAFRAGWIDQLYVLPEAQGRGAGTCLLEIARSRADALSLWSFQRNEAARRFYERRGFVVVQQTDGANNEAHEPDVLYRWIAPARTAWRHA